MPRPPFSLMLGRAWHCVCPRCGVGALYRKDVRMYQHCPSCGLSYYPESGFYVGGMILNYIFTIWIVIAVYLVSLLLPDFLPWSINVRILLWMVFAIGLSLLFWRHTRSLWLALNYWIEPHDSDPAAKIGL
jgi:uncharacterized protein (DUF983 family)